MPALGGPSSTTSHCSGERAAFVVSRYCWPDCEKSGRLAGRGGGTHEREYPRWSPPNSHPVGRYGLRSSNWAGRKTIATWGYTRAHAAWRAFVGWAVLRPVGCQKTACPVSCSDAPGSPVLDDGRPCPLRLLCLIFIRAGGWLVLLGRSAA